MIRIKGDSFDANGTLHRTIRVRLLFPVEPRQTSTGGIEYRAYVELDDGTKDYFVMTKDVNKVLLAAPTWVLMRRVFTQNKWRTTCYIR